MKISTRYFAATAAVLYGLLVAFQLALVAGAPWGRAAYRGFVEQPGIALRASSVVAAIVWSGAALVILKRAGFAVWAPLPRKVLPAAVWVLGAMCLLAIVANAMTPSDLERAIWLPFAIGMAVTTFGVAISARRREAGEASVRSSG